MSDETQSGGDKAEGVGQMPDPGARDAAIAWAVRAHAESFEDWDALADWLAADPRHAELYDQATIAADEGLPLVHGYRSPVDEPSRVVPLHRRSPAWVLTGLAAAIIATVGGAWMIHGISRPELYAIATKAGETRDIQVDEKSHILLDGASRIILDRRNPRFAALEAGEALFRITHDARHAFIVKTGDISIQDVGTIFDVERTEQVTTVSVAQGAVHIEASGGAADASAGQAVTIDAGRGTLMRRDQDPTLIGAWRRGRIDFADISMVHLAARLSRVSGQRMLVSAELRERHVSGSIELGSDTARALRQLSALLDITIERRADAWVWSKDGRAGAS